MTVVNPGKRENGMKQYNWEKEMSTIYTSPKVVGKSWHLGKYTELKGHRWNKEKR